MSYIFVFVPALYWWKMLLCFLKKRWLQDNEVTSCNPYAFGAPIFVFSVCHLARLVNAFARAGKGIKLRFLNVQFSCHIWFAVFGDVISWNLQDGYIICERCGKVHTFFTGEQSRHWQEPFCMVSLWKLSMQRSQNDAVDVLFGCNTWWEEIFLVQSIDDRYTAACL